MQNIIIKISAIRSKEIYDVLAHMSLDVWDTTRKVAFSNSTISSAPHMPLNSDSCASSCSTFGMRLYTIWDQARYSVSSQIDVAKHRILNLCTQIEIRGHQ
jgi:hypothetical protein